MAKKKSIKKNNVFWFGVISYFTDVSSEMLMPILPIFFQETLGINKALIGVIEGVAESFSSFMKVVSGYISDKLKKRKIFITFGYGLPAFIKPMFAFASNWLHVFFLRLFERSGKGFRDPPRDALIAASTERKHFGGAFGFQRMMDTFGAVTGVIILTIILYFMPDTYRPLFYIAFIPGFISFLFAYTKVKEKRKATKKEKPIKIKDVAHLPKRYKFFLVPTFIFAIGNMSYAFFILRAENLGLAITFIPVVYLIYTITYAAVALPAGRLADKIGTIPVLIMGNLFFLASCMLFAFKLPSQISWIVFVLYGLFFAFNVGVAKAYISDAVRAELRATAVGIHNFIMGICALPASAVVGFLWDTFNATVAFGYSATLAAISTILYIVLPVRAKHRESRAD